MKHHQLSIIIPVLNEEIHIQKLLNYIQENSLRKNVLEIIVADGGSLDNTKNIVKRFSIKKAPLDSSLTIPVIFLESKKGRAKQMNLGAKHAKGNILYFLHADSLPPKHFDELIINEITKEHNAGCFRMQFDSNHWWLCLTSWLTQFKWRACRGGDQSQFITTSLFNDIGGFNEDYIVYEDNILINELYARNQFVVINKKLKSSARLYHKIGVWKLQYIYCSIYVKKWFGASCDDLYQYYKKQIG